jgi:hypothetical protein
VRRREMKSLVVGLVLFAVFFGTMGVSEFRFSQVDQQPPLTRAQVLNIVSSNIARDPGFFLSWASASPSRSTPRDIISELQAFSEIYTATDGNARAKTLAVLESMTSTQFSTARAILSLEVDVDEAEAVTRTQSEFEARRRAINQLDSPTTNALQSGRVTPP